MVGVTGATRLGSADLAGQLDLLPICRAERSTYAMHDNNLSGFISEQIGMFGVD